LDLFHPLHAQQTPTIMMPRPVVDARQDTQEGAAVLHGPKVVLVLDNKPLGELSLSAPRITIGRRTTCDIAIDHPAVSGTHAVIYLENNVYAVEDLESTNGTLVNGVAVKKHVLQHLDVIEVGRHKLYYFDDASIMNARAAMDTTVSYATTVLSSMPRPAANDASDAPIAATQGLVRNAKQVMEELEVYPLEAPEVAQTPVNVKPALPAYVLRYLSGPHAGGIVELDRDSVTLGEPGSHTVAVMRRSSGYFLTHLTSKSTLRVNGTQLGPGAQRLSGYDFIDIDGTMIEFIPRPTR
jgi:pSer/pThr/pTyr-binding forkhead associated (FHA) protein